MLLLVLQYKWKHQDHISLLASCIGVGSASSVCMRMCRLYVFGVGIAQMCVYDLLEGQMKVVVTMV